MCIEKLVVAQLGKYIIRIFWNQELKVTAGMFDRVTFLCDATGAPMCVTGMCRYVRGDGNVLRT